MLSLSVKKRDADSYVVVIGKKKEMQIVMLSMSANKKRDGEERCHCR
jgi:hypothetical protein